MSYQNDDIATRIVRAQSDLKILKATQIIGGSNMSYFEYKLPRYEFTIPANSPARHIGILIYAKSTFPLFSIEFRIQEKVSGNWVDRVNPYGNSPAPYGAAKNSSCSYTCADKNTVRVGEGWGQIDYIDLFGRRFEINDPRFQIYDTQCWNGTSSAVDAAFDNIIVRCSSLAEVWITDIGSIY